MPPCKENIYDIYGKPVKDQPGQTQSWRPPCPWSRQNTRKRQLRFSSQRGEGRGGLTYPDYQETECDEYWPSQQIYVAQATWWKTIKNLRVHLNITKVKVVHHVSHQNFFKKSNIGIVLPLKERMAPSLFSWNRVENINFDEKGHLSVRPMSFSIWVFLSRNPENLQKSDRSGFEWVGWLLTFYNPEKPYTFFCTHLFCCSSLILFHCSFIRKYSSTLARLFVSRTCNDHRFRINKLINKV